jgi:hypothetical protein
MYWSSAEILEFGLLLVNSNSANQGFRTLLLELVRSRAFYVLIPFQNIIANKTMTTYIELINFMTINLGMFAVTIVDPSSKSEKQTHFSPGHNSNSIGQRATRNATPTLPSYFCASGFVIWKQVLQTRPVFENGGKHSLNWPIIIEYRVCHNMF